MLYIVLACAFLAAFASLIIYMRYSAAQAVLETVRLTDGGDDVDGRDGGDGGEGVGGLRVVQISDVHIKVGGAHIGKIAALVRDAAPHVVALTGDYIESAGDVGRFMDWIRTLIESAEGATFYLCFGNHDERAFSKSPGLKRELAKSLKRLGVYIIENRTATFTHDGNLYAITGFSDCYAAPPRNAQKALKGAPKDAKYHIGISHNPDLALELRGPRPDLLLFGHFHGGQIWMPFHLEYACLRGERLCKLGIRRGLHNFGGRLIYISRGLGCVLVPLRLGSVPEVTLFKIP